MRESPVSESTPAYRSAAENYVDLARWDAPDNDGVAIGSREDAGREGGRRSSTGIDSTKRSAIISMVLQVTTVK